MAAAMSACAGGPPAATHSCMSSPWLNMREAWAVGPALDALAIGPPTELVCPVTPPPAVRAWTLAPPALGLCFDGAGRLTPPKPPPPPEVASEKYSCRLIETVAD